MRNLSIALLVGLLASLPAQAGLIGVVIDPNNPEAGAYDPIDPTTPETEFFIPLSSQHSGVFGSGAGESADTCSTSIYSSYPSCGGGWLQMFILFDPIEAIGQYQLTLNFDDLDLLGVNDPSWFVETLVIFGDSFIEFVFTADNEIVFAANHDTQTLVADVYIGSTEPYYIGLLFGSHIFNRGTFRNTVEMVSAELDLVSVPEPGVLSLLGAGLIAVGFAGRRRRKAAQA